MKKNARRSLGRPSVWVIALATCALLFAPTAHASDYFAIKIVDEQTGRGVPLVELQTTDHVSHITDSAGMVAFNEPGLMNETVFLGKIFWFWGDTSRVGYPLGNFSTTGATSDLPANGGLAPSTGVNLHYFSDGKGFVKKMVPLSGPGPVWIDGLMILKDESGD